MVIKLRLENNGDVVDITNKLPVGFLRQAGAKGFGIAPTTLIMREGALEGARWRRTKRGPREITLPIAIQDGDEMSVLASMRRLVGVLNDSVSAPLLYATYPDGTEVFTAVHYSSGGDHQYGIDTDGTYYAKWPLVLKSESPYWTDVQSVNYSMSTANSGRGLIKATAGIDSLAFLRLSSSSAIGSISVENPGDVAAYPLWQVIGPGDFFTATINGVGFYYNEAIAAGQTITIDTEKKTVTDSSGNNKYASLNLAPRLFPVPRGESIIDVAMDGANANSRILFNFQPRYEVVF